MTIYSPAAAETTALFFELIQVSLGTRANLSRVLDAKEWEGIYEMSLQQAVAGVIMGGLSRLPEAQLPSMALRLQWIGVTDAIEKNNKKINNAVVSLCSDHKQKGIPVIVFKGQTIAALYPKPEWRQSGDIDYYVRKEDWQKAIDDLERRNKCGSITNYVDYTTEKDVQYERDGVEYEMHRMMLSLASPKHRRYWEQVVIPEILSTPWSVNINGCEVPTLAPMHNILYVFAHIFEHLILDGIGLRQFCDLYWLLNTYSLPEHEIRRLEEHLEGLGLSRAFTGLCAILTDFFGMPAEKVPLPIKETDHKKAPLLMQNIVGRGNFGHNIKYNHDSGASHGVEHLTRVVSQSCKFAGYAPAEVLWRVPYMFQWRIKRAWRGLEKA